MNRLRQSTILDGGFTIIEVLVVVAIIGILVGVAVPAYLGFSGQARKRTAQSDVRMALPSTEAYASANNDSYGGIDAAALRSYDSGLASTIDHVSAADGGHGYCIGATYAGETWSFAGPAAKQWYTSNDCASGTEATP